MTAPLAPPSIDDTTRRQFLVGAAALLAACGSNSEDEASTTTSGYPRTVRHAKGTVTLERKPARVLATRAGIDLDTLLALGIVPDALNASAEDTLLPWQTALGADRILRYPWGNEPNQEELAGLDLDVAFASERLVDAQPDEVAIYQEFMPLIVLPNAGHREQLRVVGEALDLTAAATAKADELDSLIAAFTAGLDPAAAPRSISVVLTFDAGTFTLYGPGSPTSGLLATLGLPALRLPDELDQRPGTDFVSDLSLERLELIDADLIIGLNPTRYAIAELERQPVFQNVAGVRAGRFHRIDAPAADALAVPSPANLQIAIDAIRGLFT